MLYFVSFIIRLLEKQIVFFMKKKEKISKALFYFVFVHNRVHFALLGIFLSGGVFLNTRTLLHMKVFPETWILMADKILALFCFFFYWIDIIEMFSTSLKYVKVKRDIRKLNLDEEEQERNKLIVDNAKIQISSQIYRKMSPLNNSVSPLTLTLQEESIKANGCKTMKLLPYSVPQSWMNEKEAAILEYKFEPNIKRTLSYIDTNESMFNYSTSNIGYEQL